MATSRLRDVKYSKLSGRDKCDVCVVAQHEAAQAGKPYPLANTARIRRVKAGEGDQQLCHTHAHEQMLADGLDEREAKRRTAEVVK